MTEEEKEFDALIAEVERETDALKACEMARCIDDRLQQTYPGSPSNLRAVLAAATGVLEETPTPLSVGVLKTPAYEPPEYIKFMKIRLGHVICRAIEQGLLPQSYSEFENDFLYHASEYRAWRERDFVSATPEFESEILKHPAYKRLVENGVPAVTLRNFLLEGRSEEERQKLADQQDLLDQILESLQKSHRLTDRLSGTSITVADEPIGVIGTVGALGPILETLETWVKELIGILPRRKQGRPKQSLRADYDALEMMLQPEGRTCGKEHLQELWELATKTKIHPESWSRQSRYARAKPKKTY